jgi:hypothetical protein
MLVHKSGGLSFVQDYDGCDTAPIFEALCHSWSFSWFRVALNTIGIDICEVARAQIEAYPDGWTLERLLALCLDQTKVRVRKFSVVHKCQLCPRSNYHPDWFELAWRRRVRRIKHGLDVDSPLSEKEDRAQKELDAAIVHYENGICFFCHEEGKKSNITSWPLLVLG